MHRVVITVRARTAPATTVPMIDAVPQITCFCRRGHAQDNNRGARRYQRRARQLPGSWRRPSAKVLCCATFSKQTRPNSCRSWNSLPTPPAAFLSLCAQRRIIHDQRRDVKAERRTPVARDNWGDIRRLTPHLSWQISSSLAAKPENPKKNNFHQTTVVWRLNWKNQMDGQKLKNYLIRDAARRVLKRRPITFRRKSKRGDPDRIPSAGSQPLDGSDDAASEGTAK